MFVRTYVSQPCDKVVTWLLTMNKVITKLYQPCDMRSNNHNEVVHHNLIKLKFNPTCVCLLDYTYNYAHLKPLL